MNNYITLDENYIPNAISGNTPIRFIQGDTYCYKLECPSEIGNIISSLQFICNKLNLSQEFDKSEDDDTGITTFTLSLTDTSSFPVCITTYDVIANILSGNDTIVATQTGIPLQVAKRQNPIQEENE